MPGKRCAVLVGNGAFPGEQPDDPPRLPPLHCPADDVRGLRDVLQAEQYGGYQITALIDRPHSEARRSIYDCLRKASSEDQVLIYYSGHGKVDLDGNLYLAGSDTDPESLDPTALSAADIQKYVSDSQAASRIVILDCCFSGAIGKSFLRGASKGELADQATQAVRRLEGQGVFYLTASTDNQTAEEKEQDQYSLLTKHIIRGISDGEADVDDDGEVRFSELCRYVQERVRTEGAQRPLSFALKSYGDPVVALTGRLAFADRREAIEQQVYQLCQQKLLHGADAAKLLGRLHRPATERVSGTATVQTLIQELHAASSDSGLFLKEVYRVLNLPDAPPAEIPAHRPTLAAQPAPIQVERANRTAAISPLPLPKRFVLAGALSLGIVVSLGIAFWAFNRSSSGPSDTASATVTSEPASASNAAANTFKAAPPLPSKLAPPANSGTSLITQQPSQLIYTPSKK